MSVDPTVAAAPFLEFGRSAPDNVYEWASDGTLYVRSRLPLGDHPPTLAALFARAAADHPERTFLARRGPDGAWQHLTYGDCDRQSKSVAQWLLDLGFGAGGPNAGRTLMILSGNSFEHAILRIGALRIGVAIAPISPAYSVLSADHGKLRHCTKLAKPGAVFAQDGFLYGRALNIELFEGVPKIVATNVPEGARPWEEILAIAPRNGIAEAEAGVTPDTIAMVLFTSGSTGMPKGVLNTHGNLASSVQMIRAMNSGALSEDPTAEPYTIVDWLPWHHTFGGNANLNGVIALAGRLYIDEGKPIPGAYDATIRNLKDVAVDVYSSVPAALASLADALEGDEAFQKHFFSRLRGLSYGGAAMPQSTYDRFQAMAVKQLGAKMPFSTGWGMTETGAMGTAVHWPTDRMGMMGAPAPGVTLKLVPIQDKYEMRIKGPHVTPGYVDAPDLNREAFDEEGFFRTGDAVRMIEPGDPDQGFEFAGRTTEDFKLTSGTWVHAGSLRVAVVGALGGLVSDGLIAGFNRDYIAVLAWPNVAACRALATGLPERAPLADVLAHEAVRAAIRDRLAAHNKNAGGAGRVERVLLMTEPPSIDGHEITDKQYINQKAALNRRAGLVELVYADPPGPEVIVIEREMARA